MRRLLAVLLVLAVLPFAPAVEGARIAPMPDLPEAFYNPATVWTGSAIYMFGGKADGVLRDEIVRYDPATGGSEVVGHLPASSRGPSARQSATAVWSGSKAYIFGGAVQDAGSTISNAIHDIVEFDPVTNTARNIQAGSVNALPYPLFGATSAWIDGRAYVFGGVTFVFAGDKSTLDFHDEILVFDPTPGPLEDMVTLSTARLPYKVTDSVATLVAGKAYLFGGEAGVTDAEGRPDFRVVSSIVEFDPSRPSATLLDVNLPRRVRWAAAGTLDGTAYVLGGQETRAVGDSETVTTSEAILRWRPGGAAIEHPLTLPIPSYAAGFTTTNSGIVLLGGRDSTGGRDHPGMSTVYLFSGALGAPTAPTDVRVVQEKRVNVTWRAPTYDGDAGIDGYRVERVDPDGSVRVLARLPREARLLADVTAPPSGEVFYRVIAFNAQGDGTPAVVRARLGPRAPDAPPAVSAYGGNGEVLLRWTAPAGVPVTRYVVDRTDPGSAVETTFEVNDTEFRDANLTNGVDYTYRVAAENSVGVGDPSPPVTVRPRPSPSRVVAVETEDTGFEVVLTWPPVAEADWYEVLRGPDAVALVRIANVTTARYTDATVESGASYWYAVRAGNEHGPGLPTEPVSVERLEPAGPPHALEAIAGLDFVRLAWQPPNATGGVDPETLTYVVKRAREGEDPVVVANDLPSGVTVFTDRVVEPGTNYTYSVQAFNPKGLGEASRPLLVALGNAHNDPPSAALTARPAGTDVGVPVTFDASFASDPDGRVVAYRFDFGDGEAVEWDPSPTATHVYDANGVYTARLTVRDDRGAESPPALAQVVIGPRPNEDVPTLPPPEDDDGGNVTPPPGTTPTPWPALAALVAVVAVALLRRRG